MKQVISSNLWDECGHGNLDNFHTTWLRRLLNSLGDTESIVNYRNRKPWFASLTSNSFNYLLTSPGKVLSAYGHFLVTESWAEPHFTKMLNGMDRVGLVDDDIQIYFTAHKTIDPFHTAEILMGIKNMQPALSSTGLKEIVDGVQQAIAAGTLMYNSLYAHFSNTRKPSKK
ncbi:iron-containing redox enzyme family protein [Candidatus Spongiihabitans sp.]|uniref:iron-containing redox enzyme family protein n=1 Tax=Candidatus Spongiihabitans sp. TaxID=3101308 RepID=UPI003C6F81CA